MTSDEAALLAVVIARPEDDLPRLVYADWLEERGEADRAEFIRVQCELGADPIVTPYVKALRRRVQTLLPGACRWLPAGIVWSHAEGPVRTDPGKEPVGVWRRGFVEEVVCKAADWLALAEAITKQHPVRKVTLTTMPATEFSGGDSGNWRARLAWPIRWRETFRGRTLSGGRQGKWVEMRNGEDVVTPCLAAEWPGIEFVLPQTAILDGRYVQSNGPLGNFYGFLPPAGEAMESTSAELVMDWSEFTGPPPPGPSAPRSASERPDSPSGTPGTIDTPAGP